MSTDPPLSLKMRAPIWRALMAIGMKFHHFAEPKPPKPTFKIIIPSRISTCGGTFKLVFYVPESYLAEPENDGYRYPVVVNFHGGGFTLGTGTDDARWASSVVTKTDAVFVSVEYRLAPEYPFSVGVEDGTDALIYLAAHADELRLDPHRIALSGFSAGGNFAFTVPLMLHDLKNDRGIRSLKPHPPSHEYGRPSSSHSKGHSRLSSSSSHKSSSSLSLPHDYTQRSASANSSTLKLTDLEPTILEKEQKIPDLTIRCIVSFYPPTDFRISRADKRATNPHPEKNLPPVLTNMFDAAYLRSSDPSCTSLDLDDPYLSPAAATDTLLRQAYPHDIVLYTCEYDMLNVEGVAFGERLSSRPINKRLHGGLIKGAVHAFDKKPNPIAFPKAADKCYAEACAELKRVFGGQSSAGEIRQLEEAYDVERFEHEVEGDTVIGEHDDDEYDENNPKGKGIERRLSSISKFRTKWKTKDPVSPAEQRDIGADKNVRSRVRTGLHREMTETEEKRGRKSQSPPLTPQAAIETRRQRSPVIEVTPLETRGRRSSKPDKGFEFGRGASPS